MLEEKSGIDKPVLAAGIDETKDVILFICALANAIKKSMDDGEVTLGDAMHFTPILMKIFPALNAIKLVPSELNDLQPEEKEQLINLIKDELDFNTDVEEVIDEALDIVWSIKNLIEKL